jgi:hypothetical protein
VTIEIEETTVTEERIEETPETEEMRTEVKTEEIRETPEIEEMRTEVKTEEMIETTEENEETTETTEVKTEGMIEIADQERRRQKRKSQKRPKLPNGMETNKHLLDGTKRLQIQQKLLVLDGIKLQSVTRHLLLQDGTLKPHLEVLAGMPHLLPLLESGTRHLPLTRLHVSVLDGMPRQPRR